MRTAVAVEPLRSPAFRRYAAGQLPSITCTWAQVVALSAAVVTLDPWALGWVVALQYLPSVGLGPWCGAVVDRLDRRRALMAAEAGLALVAAGFALAAATGSLSLPVIAVLATVWGVVNAFDTPARRALVPMLVPATAAASAAALSGTLLLAGMTAGAALGGLLVPLVGVAATFAVNAASFAVDVAVLATIRVGPSARVPRAPRQVRDGIAYVWREPGLRRPMLAVALVTSTAFSFQVSAPVLMQESFGGGAGLIGAALAAFTAGSLAGTLVAAAGGLRAPATATAVLALAMVGIAAAPTLALTFAAVAVAGFAWSGLMSGALAALQRARPELMGRVMALFALVLLGGMSVAAPLAAWLAGLAGPRAPFVLGAAGAAVATVHLWRAVSGTARARAVPRPSRRS